MSQTAACRLLLEVDDDGDVSRREFVGPADVFDRLDADHDGLIDADEAEKAEKPGT